MWMQTRDARVVDLLSPNLAEVTIQEVAHALARIGRFAGHTRTPGIYSVAQHCAHVAEHVHDEHKLSALMHDAHEAFLGDITSPVKLALRALGAGEAFESLDDRLMLAVKRRWGCWGTRSFQVKRADLEALVTERRDLLGNVEAMPWNVKIDGDLVQPWTDLTIDPWTPEQAEWTFLQRFGAYGGIDARSAA